MSDQADDQEKSGRHADCQSDSTELTQHLAVGDFAPSSVLINQHFEVVNLLGPLAIYLEFPPPEVRLNLLAITRPGLGPRIRTAVHIARKTPGLTVDLDANFKWLGVEIRCTIKAKAVFEPRVGEWLFLVAFQHASSLEDAAGSATPERISSHAPFAGMLEHDLPAAGRD
ncbi:MAG: domain S-box protein, partial [Planctomycetaceae bacterium]|nr:domain S-box protein [Planctomycetaceae bacterium]